MRVLSIFRTRSARDKPQNNVGDSAYTFLFGQTTSGRPVNEHTALQTTAVYSCVRILAETLDSLPIHIYSYTDTGKERIYKHSLYQLLHD